MMMMHLIVDLVAPFRRSRRCLPHRTLVFGKQLLLLAQKPVVVEGLAVQQLGVVEIQSLPVHVVALDLMDFLLQLLYFKLSQDKGPKSKKIGNRRRVVPSIKIENMYVIS